MATNTIDEKRKLYEQLEQTLLIVNQKINYLTNQQGQIQARMQKLKAEIDTDGKEVTDCD